MKLEAARVVQLDGKTIMPGETVDVPDFRAADFIAAGDFKAPSKPVEKKNDKAAEKE